MKRRLEIARDTNNDLSMRQGCQLLSVPRSMIYYKHLNRDNSTAGLMHEIRETYERHPFKGYPRITDDLVDKGHRVNHKRVYRLMKVMGLQAVYPKINLSKRRQADTVYPYLLKDNKPS